MKKRGKPRWTLYVRYILLALFLIWTLFPLYWMLSMSTKEKTDILAIPPKWFFVPVLKNYLEVLQRGEFLRGFYNSTVIGLLATLLSLIIGVPAAYVLSRFHFKGRENLEFWVLSTRMMPPVVVLIPYFLFFRSLNLMDTKLAVVLMHTVIGLPLVIWFMRGYFMEIPGALEEAALVDGCTYWSAFTRIILPTTFTGVVAVGILTFLFSWNEFLISLILTSYNSKTAPVTVYNFISFQEIAWGPLTAAGIIVLIPVIVFVMLVQRDLVRGMTLGAVKE
ncbi:MAG: carbohydrate ABC transporter permease [Atribacterota bacterium]